MALKIPYATVAQANSYLSNNDDWLDLSSSAKNVYLVNGRYYIDANYECSDEVDMDDIPEEYVYANSLLAGYDLASGLFTISDSGDSPIVKKMVKAGEVESEVTYAGSRSTSLRMNGIDRYPDVTALLSEYCNFSKGSSVKCSSLLRA